MAKKTDTQIKITQVKSSIGYNVTQRRTLEALGIRKMHHSVVKTNTPQIQGMVKKIQHLVLVEDLQ